jgi:hypothetical protein
MGRYQSIGGDAFGSGRLRLASGYEKPGDVPESLDLCTAALTRGKLFGHKKIP